MELEVEGKKIVTDNEGYLANLEDWSEGLAEVIAARESLQLTSSHWEIVRFLRRGYEETGVVPNIRQLQKLLGKEYGPEKADKAYLYDLFPYGPAKQACRVAGLPKPTGCV